MPAIQTIGILGAGQMGNGIAHVFAAAGYDLELDFTDQRTRLKALAAEGFTGPWLFGQADHFFSVRSGADLRRLARRKPREVVLDGWQVIKRQ